MEKQQAGTHSQQLSILARGGLIGIIGGVSYGIGSFVLVVVISRGLEARRAGIFFEAVAFFTIATKVAGLGADSGLVKTIASYRALGREIDLRASLRIALFPALIAATTGALLTFLLAPQFSAAIGGGGILRGPTNNYLRTLAFFLPVSTLLLMTLAATQGFGTMLPSAVIDRLGKTLIQLLLITAFIWLGLGPIAIAIAWALPMALALVASAIWLRLLLRTAEQDANPVMGTRGIPRNIASEFWRFSAPRGLAGIFQVTVVWLDTLLIGAFGSPRAAAIYTSSSRYVFVGLLVLGAVVQVTAPLFSELLARQNRAGAQTVYRAATWWLCALTWPMYLTLAIFAPLLLRVFGSEFAAGRSVLVILSLAMLASSATGPIDMVLLMGGKSVWNLLNTFIALSLNIALNVLLIPRMGIEGAAIAWAVSIVVNNLLPLLQVWRLLRINPFGSGFPVAVLAPLVAYGGVGLLTRVIFGLSLPAFGLFAVASTALYAVAVWRFRDKLHLRVLSEAIRFRSRPINHRGS